jgi:transcriptional regulator with XRE-family HTH domain
MSAALKSVADLCAEHGIDARQLAERAGLDERRVAAIVEGRWTPSPAERDRVAAAFGLAREEVAWGHRAAVDSMYGHGPQFGRSP